CGAVRGGIQKGMQAGFESGREAGPRLGASSACRNLVSLWFAREAARKASGQPLPSKKVGVVGVGVMGAGIAQLAALSGYAVEVQEVSEPALEAGRQRIEGPVAAAAAEGRISHEEMQLRREAVGYTTTWQGFGGVDLVVEAALEDAAVKRTVFRELDERTPPAAVLATNTSSLTVGPLAEGLKHPQRVAGL